MITYIEKTTTNYSEKNMNYVEELIGTMERNPQLFNTKAVWKQFNGKNGKFFTCYVANQHSNVGVNITIANNVENAKRITNVVDVKALLQLVKNETEFHISTKDFNGRKSATISIAKVKTSSEAIKESMKEWNLLAEQIDDDIKQFKDREFTDDILQGLYEEAYCKGWKACSKYLADEYSKLTETAFTMDI